MSLSLFFSPLSPQLMGGGFGSDFVGHHLDLHIDVFPDWQAAQIVLIGVPEERGTVNNKGTALSAYQIRQKLYHLRKGHGFYQIADLGDLRPGPTLEDTLLRVKEICHLMMAFGIMPVLLGGSHDLCIGQYWAYEDLQDRVSVLNIDAFADMDSPFSSTLSDSHVHSLLLHEPNYLYNYTLLAYQSYLVSQQEVKILEKIGQKTVRLGEIRQDFKEAEPLVREASMMAFDLTAIRRSDAPANARSQPFGLTAEEACQLCWYAGLSERLTSVGFYECNPVYDLQEQTATVVATMIWYLFEGFYHRPHESGFDSSHYVRYTVQLIKPMGQELVFYKDTSLEKWWMQLTFPQDVHEAIILPCSYRDYETATRGELPYRWVRAMSKL
jgi:formiminoglutamase